MALITDDFNRADTTDGLGNTPDGDPWEVVQGPARIASNRAEFDATGAGLITTLTGNLDMSVDTLGIEGAGLYFRYVDWNNWWRIYIRIEEIALGYTEYEWFANYGSYTHSITNTQQYVYDANDSASWRDAYGGWRTDNDYVYQGEWSGFGHHRGYWFFPDSTMRSNLSGKNITRIRLRVTRRSEGGASSAQTPDFRMHDHSSQPSGEPGWVTGVQDFGAWAWGETRTVDIPIYWGRWLRDGDSRGICLYTTSDSPYMIFNGDARLIIDTSWTESESHEHNDLRYSWSSYSNDPHPNSYSHSHTVLGATRTHSHDKITTGRTGDTRFIQTGTSYDRFVRLQRRLNGNIDNMGEWSAGRDSTGLNRTERLRVTADDGDIRVYSPNYSSSSVLNKVSDTHKYAKKHGLGFSYNGSGRIDNFSLFTMNLPPYAPTLASPTRGEVIDRAVENTFTFQFNDPDSEDSISRFQLEWRPQGGTATLIDTWTTTDTYHTFAANHFAAGDYEWRVRTFDAEGEMGPWSDWETFGAYDVPAAPTITSPTSGETLQTDSHLVEWTAASQEEYEISRIADDNGAPNTEEVYFNEVVAEASTRSHQLSFPSNGRSEWVQIRVFANGLWSAWSRVRVSVQYTPPASPDIAVETQDDRARILFTITHPDPVETQPNVTKVEFFRFEQEQWNLVGEIGPDETVYEDLAPASLMPYQFRITVHGDNGTTTSEDIETPQMTYVGVWLHAVNDFEGTIHNFRFNDSGGSESEDADATMHRVAGRRLPVAEFGEGLEREVRVTLMLDDKSGDVEAMKRIIDVNGIVCYRDHRGRKIFGILNGGVSRDARFWGEIAQLRITAVDYQGDR